MFVEMNLEQINKNANLIKECLVKAMKVDGLLTQDQADDVAENWAVIMKPKHFLGKIWDKILGDDEDVMKVQIVKRVKFEGEF